ncbi:disulfide bond formation protein B [Candidatus Liberibacter sp.]|uniref:disulfide bond formation protein B n=1 Tax=Candidatus Liberibacter sp. TaxID=34022 RepID=UPI002174DC63|nr:disulfide bond formation protein B [Candidatus Liberibacter sp.]
MRLFAFKLKGLQLINILVASILGIVLTILALQYIFEYTPCKLCLQEQKPYYYCLPIAVLAGLSGRNPLLYWLTCFLLIAVSAIMIYDTTLGFKHVGIEWNIEKGKQYCTSNSNQKKKNPDTYVKIADISHDLGKKYLPSCSQNRQYVLGISLASWNIVLSSILAIMSCTAVVKILRERHHPHLPNYNSK